MCGGAASTSLWGSAASGAGISLQFCLENTIFSYLAVLNHDLASGEDMSELARLSQNCEVGVGALKQASLSTHAEQISDIG